MFDPVHNDGDYIVVLVGATIYIAFLIMAILGAMQRG